eukprot:15366662-Ditylum_brightwellii.AAC.1
MKRRLVALLTAKPGYGAIVNVMYGTGCALDIGEIIIRRWAMFISPEERGHFSLEFLQYSSKVINQNGLIMQY